MSLREFTASVDVPALRSTVFAHVDDPRLTCSYVEGLVRWQPRSPVHTHEVGTVIDATLEVAGSQHEGAVLVTERVPDERISWQPESGYPVGGGWEVRDGRTGAHAVTHVVFRLEIEVPGGVAGKLIAKALEPTVRSVVDRSLRHLADQITGER